MAFRKAVWVALMLGLVANAQAQVTEQSQSPTISMDVTEAYLEDVLKILSKQSGMNFAAAESVREKQVTLYFDQVPISDALATLLKANQLTLTPGTVKNLFVIVDSGEPTVSTVTQVFTLKYARVIPSAGEILPTFGLSGSLIQTTFGSSNTSSTSGSTGTSTTTGTSGLSGLPGLSAATSQNTASGPLSIVRSMLTDHGSVIADPRTNSLIVTDIPDRVRVIGETLAKLDSKPKQIFIEAEVLEVTLDTLRRLGLEWGTSTGQLATYSGPQRTTFFPLNLGALDGATQTHTLGTFSLTDADVVLKMLATESDVKFLARPRLLTLSNEVAEIRIVSEAVTGLTSFSQQDTGTITEEPERTTVGTILRVTPQVNDEKNVTMVIEPEVSRVIQSSTFSNFLDPNRRVARTTVLVPNGGTAMIAGLISNESSNASRRIPLLGDLPIIGIPFKRQETEKTNTEILLFITPHIMSDGDVATEQLFAKEREQAPLASAQERALISQRRRILKERAIVETIDSIAW